MRDLARGRYSRGQVAAQLSASSAVHSARFDLVDRALNVVGVLDVTAAVVDWDGNRPLARSLRLTMVPRTELLDVPYRLLVKPWYLLKMDNVDGGWAEFPLGAYVFSAPERAVKENAAPGSGTSDTAGDGIAPENPELWTLTLADQTHYLDAGGVGPVGFTVPQNGVLTDAIASALVRANFTDLNGIASSAATATTGLTWSLRTGADATTWAQVLVPGTGAFGTSRNLAGRWYFRYEWQQVSTPLSDQVTTWLGVCAQLHRQLGYSPPYFDLDDDRYIAEPAADYSLLAGAPTISYSAGQTTLLLPGVSITPNLSAVANRAIVTQTNPTGPQDVAIADLDTLIPGHPLSRGVVGFYIDVAGTSPGGASYPQLQAQANTMLYTAVRTYESVRFTTMPNPAHDAWEIVSLQTANDPVFGTAQLCAEQAWSWDLFAGVMTHDARRLGIPATAQ